ncbi:hypothetical protein F5884DRAFT_734516 [Xylogone sp. PMI_703]|nr:hypothetical protein F5884DRAFT_734516 [Xylogone sp. PMI_703]
MPSEGTRQRLRSNHACINCRRKKIRCPGEKPSCSCCIRLSQTCSYAPLPRAPLSDQPKDRLADLEEKVNLILNGNIPIQTSRQEQILEEIKSSISVNTRSASSESRYTIHDNLSTGFGVDYPVPTTSSLAVSKAIDLYFKHCHRQPIWCFNINELEDQDDLPDELAWSIQALASRFSRECDNWQHYGDHARRSIMLRVANGTVELATIESLCLLSYAFLIDGEEHLGQFHLSLAFQLCRSAMLDAESTYTSDDPLTERKKRLFWSLQLLEQCYGRQTGLLSIPIEIWRPRFSAGEGHIRPPPLPRDDIGCSTSSDTGIWSMTVYFGWIWSRIRSYMSDCASNKLKEPWLHDSMYSMVYSDLMEVENRTPLCHRYESVKFYERKAEELRLNQSYWIPWLKAQFVYHAILTVLNHPFLYIVASQHNPNLAIPNSFWRRSSELVLLHATWIVRLIDMASDKQVRLVDPSLCHMAAIAATVQLYFCCAADPRLKYKSNIDLAKCRRFMKSFVPLSRACEALDQTMDKLVRIASGSESMDYEDWMPSRIHLNIPLMWNILQYDCNNNSQEILTGSLLPPSATPASDGQDIDDNSTLEIIATTSPEVTVDTADGGQAVPMPVYRATSSSAVDTPRMTAFQDRLIAPTDTLMFSTSPWLWADGTQFNNVENMSYLDSEINPSDTAGSAWWDLGNL